MKSSETSASAHAHAPRASLARGVAAPPAIRVVVLCCAVMLTACPAPGGKFAPIANQGAIIVSTGYDDGAEDGTALLVKQAAVSVKVHGDWSVMASEANFTIEVVNESDANFSLDLRRASLTNTLNDSLEIRSVRDATSSEAAPRIAFVPGKSTRKFFAGFAVRSRIGRATEGLLGQTAVLRLPIEAESVDAAPSVFSFAFKYAER